MSGRPRTRYARSGDLDIAYAVVGDGPLDLVVVPPGLALLESSWEFPPLSRFWMRLASFARLILLDKRGTGLSDRVTGVPTLEERMDDVRVVMDAVGAERAALFGGSEAGPITALFAATYPERTQALVLCGAFVRWSSAPDFPWGYTEEEFKVQLDYIAHRWGSGQSGETWYAPSLAGDDAARDWVGRMEQRSGTPSAIATLMAMNALIDIRPVLPTVSVPSLVIHRTADRVVDIHHGRHYAAHIPEARYLELPGDDHWWWLGDVDAVVDPIEEFLTGSPARSGEERVLKTVLFTDIVGSTKLAVELGDRRWKELLDAHDDAVRRQLDQCGGRAIKTTGDGFLAAFDGPARAIGCAQTIATDAKTLGLQVRSGLHTGECELRSGDLAGIAVHIGARVAALAGAGEVLVTSTVRDLVAGSGIGFADRGHHELKGVPGTWQLLAAT
jgi:class 3 adenylate cyclase/pimeloyl-ACP methyl ester carboxylesterase